MRYTQESCKLLYKSEIAPGIYNYTLSAPAIAGAASAGQFVQILCGDYTLRRPISICGFDAGLGILRLVFEIRGKGTAWLAQRQTRVTTWISWDLWATASPPPIRPKKPCWWAAASAPRRCFPSPGSMEATPR